MSLPSTGTVNSWLNKPDRDWSTNDVAYEFGGFDHEGMLIRATKHPDKTISIHFAGLRERLYDFQHPIPPCGPHGLLVTFVWTPDKVTLRLNAQLVETRDV